MQNVPRSYNLAKYGEEQLTRGDKLSIQEDNIMSSVWIRLWFKSKDEVIIKRKRWGFPVKREISYYDFASTRSNRNRCEAEVVAAVQTLRKKLRALAEADETHKGDLAFAEENNDGSRFGVSSPRHVPLSSLKDYGTFHGKPDESAWREALNPKWVAGLGLGKKAGKSGVSTVVARGPRKAYTTATKETLSEHRVEFTADADSAETFEGKGADTSPDKGDMKAWKKQWRADNQFDSVEHGSNKAYEKAAQEAWKDSCG